ncbi:MAG: hypothetical protein V4510_03550 [bacterium]
MRWATSAIVLLLCFAAVAQAAEGLTIQAHLSASSLQTSKGTVRSSLTVAFEEDATDTPGLAPSAFALRATHIRAETDSADISLHPTSTPKRINPTTTPADYDQATVRGTANRAGHRWNLASLTGEVPPTVEANCGQTEATKAAKVVRVPLVTPQRGNLERDTSRGLAWQDCTALTVRGDFQLSLWEWDATLQSGGQSTDLKTGSQPSPLLPDNPVAGRDVEVYLFVKNGTLTLPSAKPALVITQGLAELIASTVSLVASGPVTVGDHVQTLQSQRLDVQAPPPLLVAGQDVMQPFHVDMDGPAGEISLAGQVVTGPTAGTVPSVWFWTLAATLLTGAVVAGRPNIRYSWLRWAGKPTGFSLPATFRQRRGAAYWHMANQARLRGRFAKAAKLVHRCLKAFPASLDGRVLEGSIARQRGHHAAALAIFTEAYPLVPEGRERAGVARLCAEEAKECGKDQEAVVWLERLSRDHFPTFQEALEDPRWESLEGGALLFSMRATLQRVASRVRDPAFA